MPSDPPQTPPIGPPSQARFAQPRRLHPASVLLGLNLRQLLQVLLFPAAASPGGARTAMLVLAIVATIGLVLRMLAWRQFRYSFDGEVLRVDEGVLSRNRRALHVDRIQQVEVDRAFLPRLFGLAALRVETAGASREVEAQLRLVTEEEAWALQVAIRSGKARANRAGTADVADPDASAASESRHREVVRVPLRHVVIASVTGSRLLVFPALIGGAFEFAGQYLEEWFETVVERLVSPSPEVSYELIGTPLAIGALAAAVVVLSLVAAIVVGLLRDANFRIEQVEQDLFVSRGLFSTHDSVLPLRRIQLVQVQRNWLRRLLGFVAVRAYSAGGSAVAERQLTIPLLREAGVDAVVSEFYPGLTNMPELNAHPRPAMRRAILRWLWAGTVLVAAVWLLPIVWLEALEVPVLIMLPLAVGLGVVEYRHLAHGVTERTVASRRGALTIVTSLAPLAKVQAVTTRATWFQRRLDLATIRVHLAGPGGDVEVLDAGATSAHALLVRLIQHSSDPVLTSSWEG